MSEPDASRASRFPLLYARQRWEWGGMDAAFSTDPPGLDLVTNVHVVGSVGEQIVVCRQPSQKNFMTAPQHRFQLTAGSSIFEL